MSDEKNEADAAADQAPEVEAKDTQERKRKTFSLADKIKVVDVLRGRVEPFVGDSMADVARQVAEATGVDMAAGSLSYLVEELPELKLGDKLIVKTEPKMLEQQVKELTDKVEALSRNYEGVNARLELLEVALNVQLGKSPI